MYKLQSNSYTISIPKVEGKDKYMKFYPSFYEALASPSISDQDFRLAIQLMYQMFFEGLEIHSEELPVSLYTPMRLIAESLVAGKNRSSINKENGIKGGAKTKQNAEKARQYDEEHSQGNLDPEATMETMLESLEALPAEEPKEEKPKAKKFTKPTIEEIKNYASEHTFQINAEKFYDFYESNGWKVGRNSMKDWKAAVRNWIRRDTPSASSEPVTAIKYEKEVCPLCHKQKLIWNNDLQRYRCDGCTHNFKMEEVINV